jgi:hypothetical protein
MWSQADDAGAKQSVGGVQQRLMQAHTAIFAVLRAVGQDFALSRQAVGFAWMLRALQVDGSLVVTWQWFAAAGCLLFAVFSLNSSVS